MIKFEKIPEEQFLLDGGENLEDVILPRRATAGSAGYDFFLPYDLTVAPNEKITVPTGIRCVLDRKVFLAILPKSGFGTKYRLILANSVGVIDSDYSGAKNFGHILVTLVNNGYETVKLKKGKAFVQGILLPYLIAEDDKADGKRFGGHGSTDK